MERIAISTLFFICVVLSAGAEEIYLGVSSRDRGKIVRVDEDGLVEDQFVTGLGIITDLEFDSSGNLYIVNAFSVQRYDIDGQLQSGWNTPNIQSGFPFSVAISPNDHAFVGMTGTDAVIEFLPDGELLGSIVDQDRQLADAQLAFSPDGNLVVKSGGAFLEHLPDGSLNEIASVGRAPGAFTFDGSENLFLAAPGGISVLESNGELRPIGPQSSRTNDISFRVSGHDVESNSDGEVYGLVSEVTQTGTDVTSPLERLLKFDENGEIIREWIYEFDGQVTAIAIRPTAIDRRDFNDDGHLLIDDLSAISSRILAASTYDPAFDLTSDGVVDAQDVVDWLGVYGASVGDANLDGEVNLDDFQILRANFGLVGGWDDGDFDVNGTVDFSDFLILAGNHPHEDTTLAKLASVPEPAASMTAVLGCLAVLVCNRRRLSTTHRGLLNFFFRDFDVPPKILIRVQPRNFAGCVPFRYRHQIQTTGLNSACCEQRF